MATQEQQADNQNSNPGTPSPNKVASEPPKPSITPIGYKQTVYTGIATDSGS